MGLPGSGKTTLAKALKEFIESYSAPMEGCFYDVTWFNADDIRRKFNDWDFSHDGRIRQSLRMSQLAIHEPVDYVVPRSRHHLLRCGTTSKQTGQSGSTQSQRAGTLTPMQYSILRINVILE
jgi:energy-coupling factor transporter ATP-binding protein EcfA2